MLAGRHSPLCAPREKLFAAVEWRGWVSQAGETEGIGASVLADLQRQRETIGRTTTTFDEMEESHR